MSEAKDDQLLRKQAVEQEATQHDAILARVERLEKENRRLKHGALACLVAIASIGLMGQATQTGPATQTGQTPRKTTKSTRAATPAPAPFVMPQNIEAQSFILKDPNGKTRAELSMGGTGPSLKLLDQSGSALVTLSLNDAAPGGPFVLLSDPQHHAGLSMSVLENAGSQLTLTGEREDIQAHLGVTPDGTNFELTDRYGFSASIGDGTVNKGGQVKKTTAASIALFNKDRKVLWSQP